MSDDTQRYFDPDIKSHRKMVGYAERVLKSEDHALTTRDLAREVAKHSTHLSESTIHSKLYYAREYIEETTPITTSAERSGGGGDPTWKWRYNDE